MSELPLRVPLDPETLRRLRAEAAAQRRATSDEAAMIITRALAQRGRKRRDAAEIDDR